MADQQPEDAIAELEMQIYELSQKLHALRAEHQGTVVPDYPLHTLAGETTLAALFGERDQLLAIHNMGQGCRYCTLWGDGINGLLEHLESAFAVVLLSKDPPELQRQFANDRGWKFRLASHGGGPYISEQTVMAGVENMPGAVLYERRGNEIVRRNHCVFGPGDLYCAAWHLLSLGGVGEPAWTPQYGYWREPEVLDDGGENRPQ